MYCVVNFSFSRSSSNSASCYSSNALKYMNHTIVSENTLELSRFVSQGLISLLRSLQALFNKFFALLRLLVVTSSALRQHQHAFPCCLKLPIHTVVSWIVYVQVLKIGDEEFRLNSIQEDGGLCDIFEEKRRGEDGNGILKESGSVWRKLSVFRTLDASEKDRVKKRSVEAQQQQKSRK